MVDVKLTAEQVLRLGRVMGEVRRGGMLGQVSVGVAGGWLGDYRLEPSVPEPAPKPLGYVGDLKAEVAGLRGEVVSLKAEVGLLRDEWRRMYEARADAAIEVGRLRAWLSVMALTHPSALEALRGDAAPEVERWG